MLTLLFNLVIVFKSVDSCAESYISGGSYAKYEQYPHSVFLDIKCYRGGIVCGGSILNQQTVLTAAHCVEDCTKMKANSIIIRYGHENIHKMKSIYVDYYIKHQNYDEERVINDVCLMSAKDTISLNKQVKRVILLKNPTLPKHAYVAGWGIDEFGASTTMLKHVSARIRSFKDCNDAMGSLHDGAFCAGPITGVGAALGGDSGSALVIDGYIQIGLVSYKLNKFSLVAYTNVSYYLNWIKRNTIHLYCYNKNKRKNKN